MNWEEFIDVISSLIKDTSVREHIYDRMMDSCIYTDQEIEQVLGIDKIFDQVAKRYISDDVFEENEDDGYDYDEE